MNCAPQGNSSSCQQTKLSVVVQQNPVYQQQNVIERTHQLARLRLQHPIYAAFDPVLRRDAVTFKKRMDIIDQLSKQLDRLVESAQSVLQSTKMQLGVHHSFLDQRSSVREADVNLINKFALSSRELIAKYNNMLFATIHDTSVSVRKQVIKVNYLFCIFY